MIMKMSNVTNNDDEIQGGGDQTDGKTMDDEMGVAVVFENSDEDAEEGNNLNEDQSDFDEDEVVEVASTSSSEPVDDQDVDAG